MQQDHSNSVAPASAPQGQYFNAEEIREAAKYDLDLFAAIVLPDEITSPFPPLYRETFRRLALGAEDINSIVKIAIALPRGHAKTTFIRLFIVWAIVYTKKRFFVIFSATDALTRSSIAVIDSCLSSDNVRLLYGDWKEVPPKVNTQDEKKFKFNGKNVIIRGFGAGAAARGQSEEGRPDVILFDDAQTLECSQSQADSKRFAQWFVATALKLRDPRGCIFIYVGNMYADLLLEGTKQIYCCVLRNLTRHSQWFSISTGAILADGSVLWPEVRNLQSLLEEYQHDCELEQGHIFMAEVQNNPAGKLKLELDLSKIAPYTKEEFEVVSASYIVVDPATSKKSSPDQVTIAYFEIYDHVPVAAFIETNKLSSYKLAFRILELASDLNCPTIFIEANAYQYELCTLLQQICELISFDGATIIDIYNSKNKVQRILKFFQAWQAREIRTSPKTHSQVLNQALEFDRSKTDNLDDILDCMEMGKRVVTEYSDEIFSNYHTLQDATDSPLGFSRLALENLFQQSSF